MQNTNLPPTGAVLSPPDERDILFASVKPPSLDGLPSKFSLRGQMGSVAMQNYGSCVGFTGRNIKNWQDKYSSSGKFIYGECKTNDGIPTMEGTYPRTLMKTLGGIGACKEETVPNDPGLSHADYVDTSKYPPIALEEAFEYRIDGFALLTSIADIKRAIYEHGPVQLTVAVYDSFDNVGPDGVIGPRTDKNYNRGLHSITGIGWDDTMFPGITVIEIMNHWGTGWGQSGFAFIRQDYNDSSYPFFEAWSPVDFIDATTSQGAPVGLIYPLTDVFITQKFGANPDMYGQFGMKGHNGLDFRAKKGTSVRASDSGTVIFTGLRGGYGNTVIIQHSWGVSLYGHLSAFSVSDSTGPGSTGQVVQKGQEVGKSGGRPGDPGAGNSTGEHLHFGIRINGVKNPGYFDWVDPLPYLTKKGKDIMILIKAFGDPTVYAQSGDTLIGFVNIEAYNKFVEGREVEIVEVQPEQLAKFRKSPVVLKL